MHYDKGSISLEISCLLLLPLQPAAALRREIGKLAEL